MDEIRAYGSRAYRLHITTKVKKEGLNRRTVDLFVTVAYGKGVVMCKQFLGVTTMATMVTVTQSLFVSTSQLLFKSQ